MAGDRALGRAPTSAHLSLLGVLAALIVVGGITKPDEFLDTDNLQLVLTQASVIGVVTVGMTFVIICGGIDLSVGAIVALASVWATTVATQEYGFAGILFTRGDRRRGLRAGQRACSSRTGRWCRSSPPSPCSPRPADSPCRSPTARPRSSPSTPCSTSASRDAYVLGIPPLVLVFAAVTVIGWLLLNRTTFGRRTVAVGGNAEAARLAGIDVTPPAAATCTCSPGCAAASPPSC